MSQKNSNIQFFSQIQICSIQQAEVQQGLQRRVQLGGGCGEGGGVGGPEWEGEGEVWQGLWW